VVNVEPLLHPELNAMKQEAARMLSAATNVRALMGFPSLNIGCCGQLICCDEWS
jgi:hypothetical protein